ncbi:MAG TPA: hypothetical protein VL442_18680 [Mucilaginibacter sp.]|nr:hypothetical protein [Mucilaginibacter sp.]
MSKLIIFSFLILLSGKLLAQNANYIVFEDNDRLDTVQEGRFKLLSTHVKLIRGSKAEKRFDIFNLYFSPNSFRAFGLDRKALVKGYSDFRQIENDVLITLTPLTDSLSFKTTKLKSDEINNLHLVQWGDLLQEAVTSLCSSFSVNDISQEYTFKPIKTKGYKMLIKRNNVYYRVDSPVLTEFYLIDVASYLFPDGYHYGEINVAEPSLTNYVTGPMIDSILRHNPSGTKNGYYPMETISRRTYLSSYNKQDSCNIYTYWAYPVGLNGLSGIGRFQFIQGIGIVNGTYSSFFDKNFIIHLENSLITPFDDYNGPFMMKIESVNGMSLKELCQRIYKRTLIIK